MMTGISMLNNANFASLFNFCGTAKLAFLTRMKVDESEYAFPHGFPAATG